MYQLLLLNAQHPYDRPAPPNELYGKLIDREMGCDVCDVRDLVKDGPTELKLRLRELKRVLGVNDVAGPSRHHGQRRAGLAIWINNLQVHTASPTWEDVVSAIPPPLPEDVFSAIPLPLWSRVNKLYQFISALGRAFIHERAFDGDLRWQRQLDACSRRVAAMTIYPPVTDTAQLLQRLKYRDMGMGERQVLLINSTICCTSTSDRLLCPMMQKMLSLLARDE